MTPWLPNLKITALPTLIPWSIRYYTRTLLFSLGFLFPWLFLIFPQYDCFPPCFLSNLFFFSCSDIWCSSVCLLGPLLILHIHNLSNLIHIHCSTWDLCAVYFPTSLLSPIQNCSLAFPQQFKLQDLSSSLTCSSSYTSNLSSIYPVA